MDRRTVLGLGLAAAVAKPAWSDTLVTGDGVLPSDPRENIILWPGTPPGGEGLSLPPIRVHDHEPPYITPHDRAIDRIGVPVMNVFRPEKPDGSALIIAPGGGYVRQMLDFEGMDIARRFNKAGVTCFVLRYRLPGEGWANRADVPLQDAQRAMRLIRRDASKYGIDPARLAAIGFSAGGHLSASLAIRHGMKTYTAVDAADTLDAKPLLACHMYPVVTMGEGAHPGSRDKLLGETPSAQAVAEWSLEKHVAVDTAPSFICLPADDVIVPPFPNGLTLFGALQARKVPSELHVFEVGGHGFSLHWTIGKSVAVWPSLFLTWAASHGFKT